MMGDLFQRNSMALGASQVAPISLGQFGLPRPDLSMTSSLNTAGGLPLPGVGATPQPPQNFLSPTEIAALGGRNPLFGGGFSGMRRKGDFVDNPFEFILRSQ